MPKRKNATRKATEQDFETIGFRVTPKQKRQIEKAAFKQGLTLSQWLRKAGGARP